MSLPPLPEGHPAASADPGSTRFLAGKSVVLDRWLCRRAFRRFCIVPPVSDEGAPRAMKTVGFESSEGLRLGVVEGDNVIDLQAVDPKVPANLADVLAQNNGDLKPLGDLAKKAPASAHKPLNGLKFGLPVARPPKSICLGLNYLEHVKEGFNRDNVPKFPTIFFRCQTSLVPHRQPLVRPKVSDTLDYEAEMVVVIGKKARHLTMDNAYSCIAGYSCFNEGSVREFQRKTTQWDMGKNFDKTGGFGPWMITADEVPRGGKGLKIQTKLKGNVMQDDK